MDGFSKGHIDAYRYDIHFTREYTWAPLNDSTLRFILPHYEVFFYE